MKAIPTEVHNENGDLVRIEFHDTLGEHIIDAEWDENEAQTSDNRKAFRQWAYEFLTHNKGYDVGI